MATTAKTSVKTRKSTANKSANKTKKDSQKAAVKNLITEAEAKTRNLKPAGTTGKKAPKAKAPKAKNSIMNSEYGKQVLQVNKQLKAFETSFKGALNRLRSAKNEKALKLTAKQTKIIVSSKKKDALFARLAELTPASKAGNYSPFKVLQVIRKNEEALLKLA